MKLALLLALLAASPAAAQDAPPSLKLPTTVFTVTATADWAATTWCQQNWRCIEGDPLYAWINDGARSRTAPLVLVGAAADISTLLLAHKLPLAKRHPKWTAAALYATSAYRAYFGVYANIREGRRDRALSRPPVLPPLP